MNKPVVLAIFRFGRRGWNIVFLFHWHGIEHMRDERIVCCRAFSNRFNSSSIIFSLNGILTIYGLKSKKIPDRYPYQKKECQKKCVKIMIKKIRL